MLHGNDNDDMPDRMTKWTTLAGYVMAAVVVGLMFWLSAPVGG